MPTETGLKVTGGYTILLTNETTADLEAEVSRLVFEDTSGIQIAEHFISDRFPLEAGKALTRQGNFEIEVASIKVANSVTHMTVWASFTEN